MNIKKCLYCGKHIKRPQNYSDKQWRSRKYCSFYCSGLDRRGIPSWSKNKHLSEEHKKKIGLGNLGKTVSIETKLKMSKSKIGKVAYRKGDSIFIDESIKNRSGKNHYLWVKDRTQLKHYWIDRDNPEYKQWRKKCLERDNYQCKMCGEKYTKEHGLVVHHILSWKDFPEERYNINNGITLCQKHHPRKRKEEQILMPIFKGLVEVI